MSRKSETRGKTSTSDRARAYRESRLPVTNGILMSDAIIVKNKSGWKYQETTIGTRCMHSEPPVLRSAMFTFYPLHPRLKMYRRIRCSTTEVQSASDLELLQCLEITFVHKSAGSFAQESREKLLRAMFNPFH